MLQIDFAEQLLYYDEKTADKLISLLRKHSGAKQTPLFHVILAQVSHRKGNDEEMQEHLKRARELFPKHPRYLWFMFDLAMERKDYAEAKRFLAEIFELDPHEITTLVAFMEVSSRMLKWKEVLEVGQRIKKSARYISKKQVEEINKYRSLALRNEKR